MFYKTSFLMRDSRSKRKNEILKLVLRDNFTLKGHFFQLRKVLRHLGNITKSHWVSRVETLKNEFRQYLSVDMLGAVFLTFLKRRTDLYVESFNPFIITAFMFLIGNTNCWFILFNMDKFQVDLRLVVDVAHLGVINASIWYCNASWYALIIIRDNLR